jgi:hypothetical protein
VRGESVRSRASRSLFGRSPENGTSVASKGDVSAASRGGEVRVRSGKCEEEEKEEPPHP